MRRAYGCWLMAMTCVYYDLGWDGVNLEWKRNAGRPRARWPAQMMPGPRVTNRGTCLAVVREWKFFGSASGSAARSVEHTLPFSQVTGASTRRARRTTLAKYDLDTFFTFFFLSFDRSTLPDLVFVDRDVVFCWVSDSKNHEGCQGVPAPSVCRVCRFRGCVRGLAALTQNERRTTRGGRCRPK